MISGHRWFKGRCVAWRYQADIFSVAESLSFRPLVTNFSKFNENTKYFVQKNIFQNVVCKAAGILASQNVIYLMSYALGFVYFAVLWLY